MIYDGQLQLLCETFKKSRVEATIISANETATGLLEKNYKFIFLTENINSLNLKNLKSNTIYRINNGFGLRCILLHLPNTSTILAIGPFAINEINHQHMFESGEKLGMSPQQVVSLSHFYENITPIFENSHLFVMLDAFAEHIWGVNNFEIVDINNFFSHSSDENQDILSSGDNDTLIDMKLMEERYAAENEMMNAVASGNLHKGSRLLSNFSAMPFEKRLDDPLRNLKNYSIIMNTLLRKAAESGGVHPLYIDKISSSFAIKIEQVPTVEHLQELMKEMYTSYCNMVKNNTTKNYSPPVSRAVLMIDRDVSANHTLSSLAAAQNINASYLSALFKRETGKTVTDYINSGKMQHAAHLLSSTSLQIQTVALHCGIMDVQYFSKLFKKYMGSSPKEYREKTKK